MGRRLGSILASLIVNTLATGSLVVAFQLSAARRSAALLADTMRKELNAYRMVLLLPRQQVPQVALVLPRGPRIRGPSLKPLRVPDTRILQRLDAPLAGFIRDNKPIESIFTREIVRDVDSGRLNVSRLLRRSRIEASFQIDESGHIHNRRIELSSTVPSIDHLALELLLLLEKYNLVEILKGAD